jgi:hypothetical protein
MGRLIKVLTTLFALFFILAPSQVAGQTVWSKTYGGAYDDVCYSVRQDSEGGFVAAGQTYSYGNQAQVFLLRTDSLGNLSWVKALGGIRDEEGRSVLQTSDGGFLIAGWTKSYGPGTPTYANVYLIKTNASGDTLWTKYFGGANEDCGYSLQTTPDSGFIIAGATASFGAGGNDAYCIKTDADGDTIWTRAYGGAGTENAYAAVRAPSGGYLLAGNTFSFGPGTPDSSNGYLVRINETGDTLWTKHFGGTGNDGFHGACAVPDGGFIAVGWSSGDGVSVNLFLVRVSNDGDSLWAKRIGGTGHDDGFGIEPTADGGFVIGGFTDSYGAGGLDFLHVKTDSAGEVQWTKTFGGAEWDFGQTIGTTADGGYILGGFTYSFGTGTPTNCNAYLIKTDENGNVGVSDLPPAIEPNTITDYLKIKACPNPFKQSTEIQYQISSCEKVVLDIYDICGHMVRTLVNNVQTAGVYTGKWDGKDRNNQPVSSGVYLVRLQSGSKSNTKRLVLVR